MTIKLTSNEKQYIEFKKLIIPIESTIQTLRNNYAAIDALIAAKFPYATLPIINGHVLNSVAGKE
jgi:hypothetical protein